MRVIKTKDTRTFWQKVKDFIWGEELTKEEWIELTKTEYIAHACMLGASAKVVGNLKRIKIVGGKEVEVTESLDEWARKKVEREIAAGLIRVKKEKNQENK